MRAKRVWGRREERSLLVIVLRALEVLVDGGIAAVLMMVVGVLVVIEVEVEVWWWVCHKAVGDPPIGGMIGGKGGKLLSKLVEQ